MWSSNSRRAVTASLKVLVSLGITSFTPARAVDLYVAGTIGEVYKGDSVTGGFALFGATTLVLSKRTGCRSLRQALLHGCDSVIFTKSRTG